MSDTRPVSEEERSRINALEGNDSCADCGNILPTWCSVSFGTLLCLECSGRHRGMGTHVSFVRSLDMDHLKEFHIALLEKGGNALCNKFLGSPPTSDWKMKYESPQAQLFKEYLMARAQGQDQQAKQYEQGLQRALASAASSGPKPTISGSQPASSLTQLKRRIKPKKPSILSTIPIAWKFHQFLMSNGAGWVHWAVFGASGMLGWPNLWSMSERAAGLGLSVPSWLTSTTFIWLARSLFLVHAVLGPLWWTRCFVKFRLRPFEIALKDYDRRIQEGRAKTNLGYTIFFPPNVSIGDTVDRAVFFIPGLLVDPLAYAKILGELSDRSRALVILVDTEPDRVCLTNNGMTAKRVRVVQHEIQTLLGIQVKEWVLAGHSLGSVVAAVLTKQMQLKRCILWGGGHWYKPSGIDKCKGIEILTVDGSNDQVVLKWSPKGTLQVLQKLAEEDPDHHVVIPNGNHSGFGNYGPQLWPNVDGERTGVITVTQQQDQILKATAKFLTGRQHGGSIKED